MEIGDLVRTNKQWNLHSTPVQGVITEIKHYHGEVLITLNGGEHRFNEFWLEKINNEWLEMC